MPSEQQRTLLSGFFLVLLFCVAVAAMPSSSLERTLSRPAQPFLAATGLDQSWGVFAPNPRNGVIDLRARLEYPDGSVTIWRPPVGANGAGNWRGYRWHKLMEHVVLDAGVGAMRRDLALYLARSEGGRPSRVVLIRRSARFRPGAGAGHGPWHVQRDVYPLRPAKARVRQ